MAEENNSKSKAEEELDEIQKKNKEKAVHEEKSWLEKIPPLYLFIGGIVIFLAWTSMEMAPEEKNKYVLIIIAVVAFLLMRRKHTVSDVFVSPREAELLVERDLERKHGWEQFPLMSRPRITPVINSYHKEGGGMYYLVGVTVHNPFGGANEYYAAKVMMGGIERAFVTFIKLDKPLRGDEKIDERAIIPPWVKDAQRFPVLDNMVKGALRR